MTQIRIVDLRACGVCPRSRFWFQKHGLDWRRFVREGIDVAELRAVGDQLDLIDRVEAAAKARELRGG